MRITAKQIEQIAAEAKMIPVFLKTLGHEALVREDNLLWALVYEAERRHDNVEKEAQAIRNRMEDVLRACSHEAVTEAGKFYSNGLNSLGELQGNGPSFDVSVALYCDAYSRLLNEIQNRKTEEEKAEFAARARMVFSESRLKLDMAYEMQKGPQTVQQLMRAVSEKDAEKITQFLLALGADGIVKPVTSRAYGLTDHARQYFQEAAK